MHVRLLPTLFLLIVATVAVVLFFSKTKQDGQGQQDSARQEGSVVSVVSVRFSPEVEDMLSQRLSEVTLAFEDEVIIAEMVDSNRKNAALDTRAITEMDTRFRAATNDDPFVAQFLSNKTAGVLRNFQAKHPEFIEIFVTDSFGLNVGQTNKTSDLYQADEAWWVDTWDGGNGRSSHRGIEFDESTQSEAISLYVPIRYGSGAVIGVGKAVLDLTAIKQQL